MTKAKETFNMSTRRLLIGAVLSASLCTTTTLGDNSLGSVALYTRCYSQMTQLVPPPGDPLLQQVASGETAPLDACMEVFDKAQLTGASGTTIAQLNDPVAQAVLNTFHNLHASWFTNQDFIAPGFNGAGAGMQDFWDTSAPALYFTQALFLPNTPISNVLTGTSNLIAVRTSATPGKGQVPSKGARTGDSPQAYSIFTTPPPFAPIGTLIGVKATDEQPVPYANALNQAQPQPRQSGTADFGAHFGGGVLGSTPYLLLNVNEIYTFKADGGVSMPRLWARSIYNDLLCRQLPVIRQSDADPQFVSAQSSIPFRQAGGCVMCHASMDRMAATIRNFRYLELSVSGGTSPGVDLPNFVPPSAAAESAWPVAPDPSYSMRPTNGVIYFRDYTGNLVDEPVTSIADLGAKLASLNDFPICVAKRYYKYFTGVDVSIGDPGDPSATQGALSAADAIHRANVISLGLQLARDQSTSNLINSIVHLPVYATGSFGTIP